MRRRLIRTGIVIATLLAAPWVAPRAACAGSVVWGWNFAESPADYTYLITPGAGELGETLLGHWFALGEGVEAVGEGHDSGSFTITDWLYPYGPGFFVTDAVGGLDWISPPVDGCIAELDFPPMLLVAWDTSSDGQEAYWILACVERELLNGLEYNFSRAFTDQTGNDLVLERLPALELKGVAGSNSRLAAFMLDHHLDGLYYTAGCHLADLGTAQWCLHYAEAPRTTGPTFGRSVGTDPATSWVELPDSCVPAMTTGGFISATLPVASDFGRNDDIYVAVGAHADRNPEAFALPVVGPETSFPGGIEATQIETASARFLVAGQFLLRWETNDETDVIGFDVVRALASEGPYVPVNLTLIPATGGGGGMRYDFRDVVPQRPLRPVYWYRIELVRSDGTRHLTEPIQARSTAYGPLHDFQRE